MTYMIFSVDAIFENREARPTYMKIMSRKSEIQKVAPYRANFGDKFIHKNGRFTYLAISTNVYFLFEFHKIWGLNCE